MNSINNKFYDYYAYEKVFDYTGVSNHIITTYREKYPCIPELWRAGSVAIDALAKGKTTKWGNGAVVIGKDGILMPNGLYQRYPNLKRIKDKDGKAQYVYDSRKGATKIRSSLPCPPELEKIKDIFRSFECFEPSETQELPF